MGFIIILIVSLVCFLFIRMLCIFTYMILKKLFRLEESSRFDLSISVVFWVVYLLFLTASASSVEIEMQMQMERSISNLEWYFTYTFLGISSITWCYFIWEFKWNAIPRFEEDAYQIIIKK